MKHQNRILRYIPKRDNEGEYIGYCNYINHRGIVLGRFNRVCEMRDCRHYIKLRLEEIE